MKIPPLPSESIYWEAFNESECLSIIMRAQNYITDELIRRAFSEPVANAQEHAMFGRITIGVTSSEPIETATK